MTEEVIGQHRRAKREDVQRPRDEQARRKTEDGEDERLPDDDEEQPHVEEAHRLQRGVLGQVVRDIAAQNLVRDDGSDDRAHEGAEIEDEPDR